LQEAKEALSGDKFRLNDLLRLLRTRQQCMVNQVAGLYPVRVFHDLPRHAENPCADTNGENPCLSSRTMFSAHAPSREEKKS
jgi:hypothetical protein